MGYIWLYLVSVGLRLGFGFGVFCCFLWCAGLELRLFLGIYCGGLGWFGVCDGFFGYFLGVGRVVGAIVGFVWR